MKQETTEHLDATIATEQKIPDILDNNQALTILVNAAHMAQKEGIFTVFEAELVAKSIRHFSTPVETQTGPIPSTT